ncbi:MAG TPA: glycosyltransferase family 4 protein [Candidatus Hydrogenedentes bacterium]|nr:glycosyltransferase family 4 protein [Candidatus Hydrogenedentota bacterium]
MKLALLAGNRFSAWHLRVFERLQPAPEITAFRAESEIQRHFAERGANTLSFPTERIHFDTQAGPAWTRLKNILLERYGVREARLLPFHDRLQGFDLIHSWELFTEWTAEALAAKEKWKISLCLMVWDNLPFNMEQTAQRREIKRRAIAQTDRFIVHTERSRHMLLTEGANPEKIVCMAPGVDLDLFSPGKAQRDRFKLQADEFVILFVGWFLPRKGIDFLLVALREALNDPAFQKKRIRLLAIGSGPGKDRVDQLVKRLGIEQACVFPGALPYDQMPEAFRAADVFVLPSIATPEWQEQFGMSLIEAMACGVPVISTWTGAIPEIVGDAGILCQPNDALSLHTALKDLMNMHEKRLELAQQGRERAERHFSLAQYAENLSGVYQALAE